MNPSANNVRNILVIRLGSLGDIVLTTLLLRCLRSRFPEAIIDLLTKQAYQPLLDGFPQINRRLAIPDRIQDRRRLQKQIVKYRYDTVIDLQNNLTSRRICSRINSGRIYRYRRPRINRWLRIKFPTLRGKLTPPPPVPIGYLKVAERLGVKDAGGGLTLSVNESWIHAAETILAPYMETFDIPEAQRPILFSPGARHQTKIWPAERWVELMQAAFEAGYSSQVIIGSSADASLTARIANAVDHQVLNVAGETDLGKLAGLIAVGTVLISADSGPMHVAAAVGTPVVGIFGPTVPEFGFAPFRSISEVVQVDDLSCRPCHPHGPNKCPRAHFRCMNDISVNRVMEAVQNISEPDGSLYSEESADE